MKGFTLIELLVVVLIIGILSAVALPQYQKTVLKSRTAEVWTNLKNLNMAANAYCLENPGGSGSFIAERGGALESALSISVKNSKYFDYEGYVDCTAVVPISFVATTGHQGDLPFMELWLNAETGRRSCTDKGVSNACAQLGFNKFASTSSICSCGAMCGTSSCYYAD